MNLLTKIRFFMFMIYSCKSTHTVDMISWKLYLDGLINCVCFLTWFNNHWWFCVVYIIWLYFLFNVLTLLQTLFYYLHQYLLHIEVLLNFYYPIVCTILYNDIQNFLSHQLFLVYFLVMVILFHDFLMVKKFLIHF